MFSKVWILFLFYFIINCQENIITKKKPHRIQQPILKLQILNLYVLQNLQNKQQTSFISRFIKILNWLLDSVKSFETKQGISQICMFRSRCEILAENLCLDFYWHVTCFEIYLPLKRCWHQWKCHCSLFSPRWC